MKKIAAAAVLLAALALPALGASDTAKERIRQTLLYGIDSQVLDAIKGLSSARDTGFTQELAHVLNADRSAALQKAVLDLFLEQKLREGEGRAKTILAGWQDAPSDLVVSAIRYLSSLGSDGLAAGLSPLVDSTDSSVASAAIDGLGKTGDVSSVTLLVGKLKSPDFPDSRKADVILALGALKSPAASEQLIAIAKNPDEEKVRRMYAADSLGRIGDSSALPVLRDMFAEKDALIRLYAASALFRFSLEDVFPALLQGLRDENWKVREQSAKSLARSLAPGQRDDALPILSYKAEFDPVSQVRLASIQALGEIGGDGPMKFLLGLYSGAERPLESREAALSVLAAKALPLSIAAIRSVISSEWTSFDQKTIESTAKVLASTRGAELREIYLRFLESANPVVRSYGVRGIAENHFTDLRERVKEVSENDPHPGTRKEAEISLSKM
jgi:HEAT repeat protein